MPFFCTHSATRLLHLLLRRLLRLRLDFLLTGRLTVVVVLLATYSSHGGGCAGGMWPRRSRLGGAHGRGGGHGRKLGRHPSRGGRRFWIDTSFTLGFARILQVPFLSWWCWELFKAPLSLGEKKWGGNDHDDGAGCVRGVYHTRESCTTFTHTSLSRFWVAGSKGRLGFRNRLLGLSLPHFARILHMLLDPTSLPDSLRWVDDDDDDALGHSKEMRDLWWGEVGGESIGGLWGQIWNCQRITLTLGNIEEIHSFRA